MHVTNDELKLETKKPDGPLTIAAAEANASYPTDVGVVIPQERVCITIGSTPSGLG